MSLIPYLTPPERENGAKLTEAQKEAWLKQKSNALVREVEMANSSPYEGGCFAKWRDRTWKIAADQINTLSDASWNNEWDQDENRRAASEANFTYPLYLDLMPNVDIAAEIRAWRALLGKTGYLYLGGTLFGTQKKYRLTAVEVSGVDLIRGEIAHCVVSLDFTEDKDSADQKLPKRKDRSTTSSPASDDRANSVKVYRFYNRHSGLHMFTASDAERSALQKGGWSYEGVAFEVPPGYTIAVHRLYHSRSGNHVWTASATERNNLQRAGWSSEGVGWYSDDSGMAVYRLYNPKSGDRLYTTSTAERDSLREAGWNYEGVGFWV